MPSGGGSFLPGGLKVVVRSPTVVRRYVRPGRVRLDLYTLTFIGPDSERAAGVAAAAAQQDAMWPFAELFFRNQGPENSG